MENNNVILDFSRIDFSDAHICDEHNLIHRSRMRSFQGIAYEQLEMAREEFGLWCQNKGKVRNVHNAISVFANRGAGKTTFLLSAIDWLRNTYPEVLCLKPIDPSMIGEKENAFVNIIAEIHEHVIAKIDAYDFDCRNGEEMQDLQRQIDKCFTRLMEALSFMEGIGKNGKYDDWDDAEFAARKGMEKAISSNNIDELFQKYVYLVLKLLGKQCIVISFDDIDTDFNKGYEILEIIRRFMTTPMIMTILTGDLELYGKLVRKASWKCFSKEFLEKEISYANRKKQEFSTMIDQLENQYLIKILKPEYRIPISTIKEYLADKDFEISVRFRKEDPEAGYPIGDCYDRLLREIGGCRPGSKLSEELKQFLLGLSLRIQIRLLSKIKDLKLMMQVKNYDKGSLAEGIQAVFWNDINQKADNAKSLIKSSPVYTAEMLKFLDYTNCISIGSAFLPQTEDEILNNALFAIGSKYNYLVSCYQHLVFDYWCRISYTGSFYGRMSKQPNLFPSFLDYSLLKTDSGLVKSMGLMQAFNASMPMVTDDPVIGVDELPEIPFFFSDAHSILSMLPSYGTVDGNRNEKAYFSIYKLLALISDMMRFCHEAKGDADDKTAKIIAQLSKLGQYRTFSIPSNNAPNSPKNDRQKDEPNENYHFVFNAEFIEEEGQVSRMVKDFINWVNGNIEVSCQSLHHIFVRFYYTMTHISGNYSIADRFNKYVLSLLNAALVEAAIDNGFAGFNMSNLGDIENIFMDNVRVMRNRTKNDRKEMVSFKFYNWLASCPLLLIFIDPAVYSYMRNVRLTIENMESWTKFHVRNKSLKYANKYIAHYEEVGKQLDRKSKCVTNMIEYTVIRSDVERDELFMRRNLDQDSYARMKEAYDSKRQRMNDLRKTTSPSVNHADETVSFGSDITKLEDMQNFLAKDNQSNDRILAAYKNRKVKLEAALSQLGLIDEFVNYENEAYSSIDQKVLSVYNIIERMYPLFVDDDERFVI